MTELHNALEGALVIISCEGGAEDAIMRTLLENDSLCFRQDSVIDITRLRKISDIEQRYLSFDYDQPIVLLYITDSLKSNLRLSSLYRRNCQIFRICTRPEIEILTIINEHKLPPYRKSGLKPSLFCKQNLGMKDVKRPEAIRAYWSVQSLTHAIREYQRMHRREKDEFCLADLLAS